MEKRNRKNQLILRLSDDEKYILDAKCKNAEYRNKNDYLRHLILYGYTYCLYKGVKTLALRRSL